MGGFDGYVGGGDGWAVVAAVERGRDKWGVVGAEPHQPAAGGRAAAHLQAEEELGGAEEEGNRGEGVGGGVAAVGAAARVTGLG